MAFAVFDQDELEVPVLDLVADSLVDDAGTTSASARHLRFAGHGRTADVDVLGTTPLTLDVRLSPHEPTFIEVRSADGDGHVATRRVPLGRLTEVRPGLTSLLVRDADTGRKLARTAWLGL